MKLLITSLILLFPAHAGMNRGPRELAVGRQSVPRTRGDEPAKIIVHHAAMYCSPHTRG